MQVYCIRLSFLLRELLGSENSRLVKGLDICCSVTGKTIRIQHFLSDCSDGSLGLSGQPSFDVDAELETVQGEQKRLRREKRRMVRGRPTVHQHCVSMICARVVDNDHV